MTEESPRTVTLVTPEGVPLQLQVAPLGSRVGAFALDLGIMVVATVIVGVLTLSAAGDGAGAGLGGAAPWLSILLLFTFLLWNGYFLFFELRWGGRTPGKRVVGLKVISRNGGPLTTGAVVSRNLMRDLEFFLPMQALLVPELLVRDTPGWAAWLALGWLLLFLFFPWFNRDRARCGDLVAGTLVVARPQTALLPDQAEAAKGKLLRHAFTDAQLDLYGIRELQVLEGLLREGEGDWRRADLLEEVAKRICRKIAWEKPLPASEVLPFLQAFYHAQRRRLEGRLLLGDRREQKKPGRLKE